MKRLLPYLFAVAAFFAARELRPPAAPPAVPEAAANRDNKRSERPQGLERRAELLASFENANPAMLEKLRRSGRLSPENQWLLLRRSAEADPEGTWEWIDSQELSESDRWNFRQITALASFSRDPEAVLSRLKPQDLHDGMIAGVLIGWLASKDPAEASAARRHLDALVQLAGRIPFDLSFPEPEDGGADLLMSLPPGRSRDVLTRTFAIRWLGSDLPAARAWMENLPATQRDGLLLEFFQQALRSQSDAAVETRALAAAWIQNEAGPADRARCGPALVEWMAREDPAAALAWASENLSSAPLANATASVVSRIFASDPDQARRIVEDLPPGNLLHRAAAEVAKAWSATDPAAAVEWWLSQAEPAEAARLSGITSALGKTWSESDPDSLRARLADPDQPALPAGLAYYAIDGWTRSDPAATLDWATSLPPDRRDALVRSTYTQWAYRDPAAAAAALAARPEIAPESARPIASSWFNRDRDGSIEWAASLPPGPVRTQALDGLKSNADFEVQLGGTFPPALRDLLD